MRYVTVMIACSIAVGGVGCEPSANSESISSAPQSAVPCAGLEGFAAYACARPEWQQRDNDLNRSVARLQAKVSHAEKQDLRSAQRRWEQRRDACLAGALADRDSCLEARYAERTNELQAVAD